jgi:hypothetical protein
VHRNSYAGAGRPLLHSLIDYTVFSELAAARGSIVSGPISRSATGFQFLHLGQIRVTRHLVIVRVGGLFRVATPPVAGELPASVSGCSLKVWVPVCIADD